MEQVGFFQCQAVSLCHNLGVFLHSASKLMLFSSKFVGNYAGTDGGGVFMLNVERVRLKDSTTDANKAARNGGGFFFNKSREIQILNSNFSQNGAADGSGGALFAVGLEELEISEAGFSNNIASANGGGLYTNQPVTTTISLTRFESNEAKHGDGGGLYFDPVSSQAHPQRPRLPDASNISGKQITIADSKFFFNKASRDGGSIFLQDFDGSLEMDKPDIENSNANGGVGGCAKLTSTASKVDLVSRH